MINKVLSFFATIQVKLQHKKIGENLKICKGVYFSAPKNSISIGSNFFANMNCYISTNEYTSITIGNAVMLGPSVQILGGNHAFNNTEHHMRFCTTPLKVKNEIVIEDGCWIGAASIVLDGTKLMEGAILGAGSILNTEIPPYSIAVGIPARVKKRRFSNIEQLKLLLLNTESKYSVQEVLAQYDKYKI